MYRRMKQGDGIGKPRAWVWGVALLVVALGGSMSEAARPVCGNGVAEVKELCDGDDLRDLTCETLGFTGGTLECTAECYLDFSRCFFGSPDSCSLPATGQTTIYATGDDGDIQAGLALSYTDNLDGTITDNNTGLIWLKDGTCIPATTWQGALDAVAALQDGDVDCGLSDGSQAGDWRLPNIKELQSIVDYERVDPAIDPTFHTVSSSYWSSTSYAFRPGDAWVVNFFSGFVTINGKGGSAPYVRAVRGGL